MAVGEVGQRGRNVLLSVVVGTKQESESATTLLLTMVGQIVLSMGQIIAKLDNAIWTLVLVYISITVTIFKTDVVKVIF